MILDSAICERARQARDPRFDGRFFVGVLTTGVYCRPVCRVRLPKSKNVRFYPTAAAASEAGFRPCLRCRPEAAPGTPAWQGTAATVARALRLIAEGALDHGTVDELATRLGIGSRHLDRLFNQHVGATPVAVAQTRRLHFAKKLIDETNLPLAEIAFAAGFGSVRRFNAVFQKTYSRSPSSLRTKLARQTTPTKAHEEFILRLPYRPPLDWQSLLDYLRLRATPNVESISGLRYSRTIRVSEQSGWLAVQPIANSHYLKLHVAFPDSRFLLTIVERVRRLFDLDADPSGISSDLNRDSVLAKLLETQVGLRVPGTWDGFELAVRAILGQQVTVKGATTLAGRLAATFGGSVNFNDDLQKLFPTPQALATADITQIGLPQKRAETIQHLAQAVCNQKISFSTISDPNKFANELTALPGIGQWTADYIVMRALNEPDAFPSTDLGLVRAAKALGIASNATELTARSEAWRPWRAYAAIALWQFNSNV